MAEAAFRKLKTSQQIKGLTDRFYRLVSTARERGEKTAWCIGPFPYEPLRAMNIQFVHQENYAARLAARKVVRHFQNLAVEWGLSKEACSYMRADHGMCLIHSHGYTLPEEAKGYELPKPDMIFFINYCVSAAKMAEIYYHHLNIPVFGLDFPFQYLELPQSETVPYVRGNLKELVDFLEKQTGRKMDYGRLSQIMAYAKQSAEIRNEVLEMARRIPSPLTGFDGMISLGASNIWRGTLEAISYLNDLKAEVEERVRNNVSAIANERLRLLWDLVAIWPRIGYFADFLAERNACVVLDTYSRIFNQNPELIDPENPIESIAKGIVDFFPHRHIDGKLGFYKQAIKDYSIDGILAHQPRTCRKHCMPSYLYWDLLERSIGIPTCKFDADHSDPDFYSPAQVETRVSAFLEVLEARKFGTAR